MTADVSEAAEPLAAREDPVAPDVSADRGDYRRLEHGEGRAQAAARWVNVSPGRRGPR